MSMETADSYDWDFNGSFNEFYIAIGDDRRMYLTEIEAVECILFMMLDVPLEVNTCSETCFSGIFPHSEMGQRGGGSIAS